jgi:hypothetical protein
MKVHFLQRHDLMIELCELFIVMMDVGQSLIVGIFKPIMLGVISRCAL